MSQPCNHIHCNVKTFVKVKRNNNEQKKILNLINAVYYYSTLIRHRNYGTV